MSDLYADLITRLAEVAWLAEEGSEVTDLANDAREAIGTLRAEVERLTAKANRFDGMESVQSLIEAYNRERALADQLAEALRAEVYDWQQQGADPLKDSVAALAAWGAARHE